MRVQDLGRLYDYTYWANAKLFPVIAQLSPEQFTQTVAGSYGSIRNTLVHILSAEWGWLDRCGGPPRGERLKAEDYPTFGSVATTWKLVEENMRIFLANLTDDDLARPIEFALGSGAKHTMSVEDLLHHGIVHAVHHRGQLALLLRMLGYTPGNFDLLMYVMDEQNVTSR